MRTFKKGQRVYWNDPAGETSGEYTVIDPKDEYNKDFTEEDTADFDERMIVIGNGTSEAEVYASELDILSPVPDQGIPNYIAYALILITAAHLGCKVKMLATAQEVWRTKRLPEAVLLGMYEKAARDAVSAVRKRGLAERADRLGEIFYRTGEFPPEDERQQ